MSTTDTALNGVVTEREARLRERAAFEAGAHYFVDPGAGSPAAESRRRYPILKKVPRVVTVAGREYRVNASRVEYRLSQHQAWVPSTMQPHAVEAVTGLIANPFEEVEE
jgi:hypothetical protein